jgi:hypothetical protein
VVSLSPEGRGRGEGVRTVRIKLRRPNPLILSFSPNSASKTRVNALMGEGTQRAGRGHPHSRQMLTRSLAIFG